MDIVSSGRPKGSPNKSVKEARRAIADFVDSNVPKLNKWLNQVADGIPHYDGAGNVMTDSNGATLWLLKPDPGQALKIVADLTEYHLPKLSRAEVNLSGVHGHLNDLSPAATALLEMSAESLVAHLQRPPVPEWLQPANIIEGELCEPAK